MTYKQSSVMALVFISVTLTGCVSNQSEQVDKKDIQKVFSERQYKPSGKLIYWNPPIDINEPF